MIDSFASDIEKAFLLGTCERNILPSDKGLEEWSRFSRFFTSSIHCNCLEWRLKVGTNSAGCSGRWVSNKQDSPAAVLCEVTNCLSFKAAVGNCPQSQAAVISAGARLVKVSRGSTVSQWLQGTAARAAGMAGCAGTLLTPPACRSARAAAPCCGSAPLLHACPASGAPVRAWSRAQCCAVLHVMPRLMLVRHAHSCLLLLQVIFPSTSHF